MSHNKKDASLARTSYEYDVVASLKTSYDKYLQCDPGITSYENDVVVSQQHVHIALSQDVSMISKNHRMFLRQFEIAMM